MNILSSDGLNCPGRLLVPVLPNVRDTAFYSTWNVQSVVTACYPVAVRDTDECCWRCFSLHLLGFPNSL